MDREREREPDPGPLALGRGQVDPAPMGLGDGTADGQAEAAAFRLLPAGRVDPVETLEDVGGVLGGDADARVGHLEEDSFARPDETDSDGPAWRRELDRIVEEVE